MSSSPGTDITATDAAENKASVTENKAAAADNKAKSKQGQAAIKRLSKPVRGTLFGAQILVAISGMLSIAPYVALVELGRTLLANPINSDRVRLILMLLVSAYSARLFLYLVGLMITHFADLRLRSQIRRDITAGLSKVPLAWFSLTGSGALRKAIQDDTATVHAVIAHGPIERLNAAVSPLALLCYAFYVDWRLGLLSVATIPLFVVFYSISMRSMPEKTAEMDSKLAKVSATMVEFVSGITVVKAFGQVGKAHGNYIKAADEFSTFYRAWCMPLVTVSCLSFMWVSIPILLVVNLGGGALLMQAGYVDIAQVLATSLIALVLPAAMITISTISWSYQLAGSAAVHLCDILDTPPLPQPSQSRNPSGHRVEVTHASYSYGQNLAVNDVSLTLDEGTVTALVGPSGSGKSTLATLIARFDDPDSGAITIGGVDLRDMDQQTLYKQVAFVLQDAQLLETSIRANIALGRPDASDQDVWQAAEAAQIAAFIRSLPRGLDTVIGQDTHLSGGQEQRVAIARALLVDAPILILDEATAFADPESEAEIQRALTHLVKGRTVLVIAHRLASIRGADQIAVMDRGHISALGTHEQLLAHPHYQALLKQGAALDATQPDGDGRVDAKRAEASSNEKTSDGEMRTNPPDGHGASNSNTQAETEGIAR